MVKKTKGFTILELIMVVGIILVLMLVIRSVFQNQNRDLLYAESCTNKIYGDINNFIYSAMTSKGLYISGTTIYPDDYNIDIDTNNNKVLLRYKIQTGTGTYIDDILTGNTLKTSYCSNSNYITKLSGSNLSVRINKYNLQDQNLPTFTLSSGGSNLFTGNTKMYLCYVGNVCKELASFIFDVRTQKVEKIKCLVLSAAGVCQQWDK